MTEATEATVKVTTGYSFSENHQRWYAGGTKTYRGHGDGVVTVQRTLRMSHLCVCGDWISDGEPICGIWLDSGPGFRIVHVNCCGDHDHSE